MSGYDRSSWEARWAEALREHGDRVARRPPNAHLAAELGGLRGGRALDAGCGHGSDTLWLAARGWQVTAVDFAPAALGIRRATAAAMGSTIAERVELVEADSVPGGPDGTRRARVSVPRRTLGRPQFEVVSGTTWCAACGRLRVSWSSPHSVSGRRRRRHGLQSSAAEGQSGNCYGSARLQVGQVTQRL